MAIRDYRPATTAPGLSAPRELSIDRMADTSGAQALGRAVFDVGAILENARQETEANDARLKLTEGVGALNRDLSADTDFRTMRGRYDERLKALGSSVMEGVTTPRVKRAMGLELARARIASEANIFAREQELSGSHARATVRATVRAAANSIPTAGSDKEAEGIYANARAAIDGLLQADHIDAEEAQVMYESLDKDTSTALALDAINRDPAAAAAALGAAGAFGLEEIDRQQYLAAATRQAEADATQGRTKLEREVDTARRVLMTGGKIDPADQAGLLGRATGTEFEEPLKAAIAASAELGGFALATPEERRTFIAGKREKGLKLDDAAIGSSYLSTLEEIDRQANEALAKSPIQYAMDMGFKGAAPLDLGDPESWSDRLALSAYMVEKYGAAPDLLAPAEEARFKDVAKTGSVEDQLALVASVTENAGPQAGAVFRELEGVDPVLRRAGMLAVETGSADVAAILLNGKKAIEAGGELYIASEEAVTVFEGGLDTAFRADPQLRGEVIASVKAYYAAEAPGRVTADDVEGQADLLNEGLQRVLGGELRRGVQYGGIQPVNGRPVRLPPGLTADAAEQLLSSATAGQWRAASLSGNLPHEGDAEVDLGPRQRVTARGQVPASGPSVVLQWVDGTIYRVGVQSNRGGIEFYQDPGVDNGFFYVDLARLGAGSQP